MSGSPEKRERPQDAVAEKTTVAAATAAVAPVETFRRNVMVAVINERHEMLLFQRNDREGLQCIQGGVEDDEDIVEAAMREAYEEAGVVCDGFDYLECERLAIPKYGRRGPRSEAELAANPIPPVTVDYPLAVVGELPIPAADGPLRYRFPPGACKAWVARGIVGQEQRCIVLATRDGDALRARVDLSGKALQPREFIDSVWFPVSDLTKLVAAVPPAKREVFRRVGTILGEVLRPESIASDNEHVARFSKTLHTALKPLPS